jgi:hypothetical protein
MPQAVDPVQAHPALDAAEQRPLLVAVEIPPGLGAYQSHERPELLVGLRLLDGCRWLAHVGMSGEAE